MRPLPRPTLPSLWRESDRRALLGRLRALSPDATPRWGRLTARRALPHLADAARFALGDVHAPRQGGRAARLLRVPPVKRFVVYGLPFPRHAPKVPALFATAPTDWASDLASLERLLERVAARAAEP